MERAIVKRYFQVMFNLVFLSAILFVTGGTLYWDWAWLFIILSLFNLLINAIVLPREVIAERGRVKLKVKSWDKVLTSVAKVLTISMYLFAGLDYRYMWSSAQHPTIHLIGLGLTFGGSALFTWAMTANPYFSTAVRIQAERGHTVATGGPYRYVRHPGYLGHIMMTIGTPLALGSLYALALALLVGVIMIIRTALEDKMLTNELTGYQAYTEQVHYRLLPLIW